MRLLILSNSIPGVIRSALSGRPESQVFWLDSVVAGLRRRGVTLEVLCLGKVPAEGSLDERFSYLVFSCKSFYHQSPELERLFARRLEAFRPDVVHIWGTEFVHTLAMVRACRDRGLLEKTVVSIQGLCYACAEHYTEGLPGTVVNGFTFRDLLRMDNIRLQKRKFALRGKNEVEALRIARHVIGRTPWDYSCTEAIHPERVYHFCNETLRDSFYTGQWRYESCRKHRIFASSCVYPVKGFHYLLEAMAIVAKTYPDVTLAVPGKSFLKRSGKDRLREDGYHRYLARMANKLGLKDRLEFLGTCSADEMKAAFLEANVFVLPSTIENSPNSMGEAMLLGVPCVAADVGGVSTLLKNEEEGLVVPSGQVRLLADSICRIFAMEAEAERMGRAARDHALRTHDPEKNLETLLGIYRELQET